MPRSKKGSVDRRYYCHGTEGQGGRDGARISDFAQSTGSDAVRPKANGGNAGIHREDSLRSGID